VALVFPIPLMILLLPALPICLVVWIELVRTVIKIMLGMVGAAVNSHDGLPHCWGSLCWLRFQQSENAVGKLSNPAGISTGDSKREFWPEGSISTSTHGQAVKLLIGCKWVY